MIFTNYEPNALKVDMKYYIKGIINEFPFQTKSTNIAPWNKKYSKWTIHPRN